MKEHILARGEILKERYRIESVIGRGAYGVVYLAGDLHVAGAAWAVKEMWEGALSGDERAEALELFEKEASLLSELNHTGIPKVVDHFSLGMRHYMVMEYIEGATIDKVAERPDPKTAAGWAIKICDILEYLHGHEPSPVIFRDLKPSNILMTPRGRLSLIDFGIARLFNPGKTKDTHVMGTPGFSPPEQYGTGQSDTRSDIYSLGATLYSLLSGEDVAQFRFSFPPLSKYNPAVTPALEAIVGKCLAANPGDRYQSVRELRDHLKAFEEGKASLPPPAVTRSLASPSPAKHSSLPPVLWIWILYFAVLFLKSHDYEMLIYALLGLMVIFLASLLLIVVSYATGKSTLRNGTLVSLLLAGVFIVLIPNFVRATGSHGGQLTACKSNLKNLGTAMEMYSTDNAGRYPPALSFVTPNYLKVIPTCASAGESTYRYIYTVIPDTYTLWCSGSFHKSVTNKQDFPQYDSVQGLIE
ncbi:MAG: protein kinase [Candidatus Eremiobacteraeota bacterium]|nr:protein kinase [Candidatus Eremiobacteraeota bacterium]